MVFLQTQSLSKQFGARQVFSGVTFRIEQGGCLAVVGRNGSGKTTLLRILSGLTSPSAGEVHIEAEGQRIADELRSCYLGLSSPDTQVYGSLSALENLMFFAGVRGLSSPRRAALAALDRVGLMDRRNDLVRSFSQGMKQRMRLSVATMHQPQVLLLDEPGANLDEEGHALVKQLVEQQRGIGLAIVATNDPVEARYGDERLELGV